MRMQPDGPETSPPKMKLGWPPKTTNLSLGSTAARRVNLATEPHVSLTPIHNVAMVLGYGFDESC